MLSVLYDVVVPGSKLYKKAWTAYMLEICQTSQETIKPENKS